MNLSTIKLRRWRAVSLTEQVKSLFNEMFGDPVENNKRWPQKPLKALGTLERGKSKHRPRNDPKLLGGPYPLIQTGDVSNAGTFITKYQSTYSELGLSQSRMWEKGTLCITIAANIAQTAIMTFDACFPDSVVGFLPFSEVRTRYMHEWFGFLQPILDGMATSVAQKNLNLEILGKVPVIVPPVELQEAYIRKVEKIDKLRFMCLMLPLDVPKMHDYALERQQL
ncbi:MAG: restriction endonuclease subunit S [Bacilli bacterium]|nr:restriction endonuclease subunit S [Bacilli bacterium]